jgi:hypothetical protein
LIDEAELKKLDEKIWRLRHLAEEVLEAGDGIPAVERNTARILASVAMLELNLCDVRELLL